ncbi:TetR/AcrR family transcriptional regulator [Oricola cellulosilytica]|uniref:TetR/AcrR family transcriptional regulator n=1 Tax=Oricola cellulosilytica TaxID=1429082 RepID=A0A4V2MP19_9HYPH|nr:TetR/AcrR family transcriptional regulator [Oricola cellulosilytica]TCD15902.1 TetR/AcrR family transcriptional regulator [Oricola cellulosilytica]
MEMDGAKRTRGAAKREALVQAAAELFWIRGFEATSLADIAAASNVPLGNIYYYYKSKADLAMAVANLFVAQTERLVADVCGETPDPRERLKFFVARLQSTQSSRVRYGCPISGAARDFRRTMPEPSARAAESFSLLTGFLAAELGRTGARPSVSLSRARAAIADWQGSIALAHALNEPTVLAECFRRMERLLTAAR